MKIPVEPTGPSNTALNILLVEDDEIDMQGVQRAFQESQVGHQVFHAMDGIHALELLRAGRVPRDQRVILLDLEMPRMTGIEFLRELRGDPALRTTPVVVLTTAGDAAAMLEAYHLHVAGYLLKPSVSSELVKLMMRFHAYWTHVRLP